MTMRATKAVSHAGKFLIEGDYSLSRDEKSVINILLSGPVEMVFDLEPFQPPIDENVLTLRDAYLLHVRDYPPLRRLLDETFTRRRIRVRLRVRDYAHPPSWIAPRPSRSKRPLKKRWRKTGTGSAHDGYNVWVGPDDPLTAPGPSREELLRKALREYLLHAATHFLIDRLARGELEAVGISESDLETRNEAKIHAGWWRSDIVLDFSRNSMFEITGPHRIPPDRRYSEIHIRRPTASDESTRRGPRSKRERLIAAFRELVENGSISRKDLRNKKAVFGKVLDDLNVEDDDPGYALSTLYRHLGREIDEEVLRAQNSQK